MLMPRASSEVARRITVAQGNTRSRPSRLAPTAFSNDGLSPETAMATVPSKRPGVS